MAVTAIRLWQEQGNFHVSQSIGEVELLRSKHTTVLPTIP
jgi:hypothetical protein